MREEPMAPKPPVSQENQAQTVAGPSVYPGAETVGMTDEERARELIQTLCGTNAAMSKINNAFVQGHIAAIRADEREKCAQVVDRYDTGDMQREDMEARRISAVIRARGSE